MSPQSTVKQKPARDVECGVSCVTLDAGVGKAKKAVLWFVSFSLTAFADQDIPAANPQISAL